MEGETLRSLGVGLRGRLVLSSLVLLGVSAVGYTWIGSSAAYSSLLVLLGAIGVGCLVRSCRL